MSKPLYNAQRRAAVEAELRRDPQQSDRMIAKAVHAGNKIISLVRKELETKGEIPVMAMRRTGTGQVQPADRRTVDRSVFPLTQRGAEIAMKAAEGMSVEQMAVYFHCDRDTLNDIIRAQNIALPARSAQGRALRIDPQKVVSETVYSLAALARSVERVKGIEFAVDGVDDLCGEAVRAMPNIIWLVRLLKQQRKEM